MSSLIHKVDCNAKDMYLMTHVDEHAVRSIREPVWVKENTKKQNKN